MDTFWIVTYTQEHGSGPHRAVPMDAPTAFDFVRQLLQLPGVVRVSLERSEPAPGGSGLRA